jgi:DNA-directed RNA polymerase omega subunit
MPLVPTEELDKVTSNRYEAVIIASKHARHLNTQRLAKLQALEAESPEVDYDSRKITMVAFKDLMDGKVKFKRADTE